MKKQIEAKKRKEIMEKNTHMLEVQVKELAKKKATIGGYFNSMLKLFEYTTIVLGL